MPDEVYSVPRIKCIRCGHEWYIRKPKPKDQIYCPKCKCNPFVPKQPKRVKQKKK